MMLRTKMWLNTEDAMPDQILNHVVHSSWEVLVPRGGEQNNILDQASYI